MTSELNKHCKMMNKTACFRQHTFMVECCLNLVDKQKNQTGKFCKKVLLNV